ncbi:Serine/threonine-protein kinase HT1 OS=Arabidopsis thaliana GN=HT1 PE=1 SV=1 [Rhizoctonia solani AG-1 IB]|uniref:Serine/threonine-protein kinase HT1 n=1 Tax=Thanatephorus cucumeris (strain AG1-IB / isolate 7/3/14) TaxID=1108050 RepID=A0A0B7FLG0_THACB|nr:Serine/threonine-protein kinase HT1 OS=Arabidopsis thaliana GN=HT1 PE=1 SV=1 [Rhizoctonia solani AG-1 IB]
MSHELEGPVSRNEFMSRAGRVGIEFFRKGVRTVIRVMRLGHGHPSTVENTPNVSRTLEPDSEPSNSPTMTATEIVRFLIEPGVPDITGDLKELDIDPILFGSSGYLYHAQYKEVDVAIRTVRIFVVLNSTNQHRLKAAAQELLDWLQLKHDNVVPLLGVASFHGQPSLVSPWMNCGLVDFRRSQSSFDWLKMCKQLSSAIAYLHSRSVVHGDIRAQNILVSDDGNAKVAGFGNSVLQEFTSPYRGGDSFTALSMRWTAPEILEGSTSKSQEADTYALGMTILEITTGRVPFDDIRSDHEVILKAMARSIPSRPSELDSLDQLWALLIQCWSSDSKARPKADQVLNVLENIY